MLFPNLISLLYLWLSRARQRRRLKMLEPWELRDIGINRRQALDEARKPCWRS